MMENTTTTTNEERQQALRDLYTKEAEAFKNESLEERTKKLKASVQEAVDQLFLRWGNDQSLDVWLSDDAAMTLAKYRTMFGDIAYSKAFMTINEAFKSKKAKSAGTEFKKATDKLAKEAERLIHDELNPRDVKTESMDDEAIANANDVEFFNDAEEAQKQYEARNAKKSLQVLVEQKVLPPLPSEIESLDIELPPIHRGEFVRWSLMDKSQDDGSVLYMLVPRTIMSLMIPTRKILSGRGLLRYAELYHLNEKNAWVSSIFSYTPLQNKATFARNVKLPDGPHIEDIEKGYDILLKLIKNAPLIAIEAERPGWNDDFSDFVSGTRSLNSAEPLVLPGNLEEAANIVSGYKEKGDYAKWAEAAKRYIVDSKGRYRGVPLAAMSASLGGPIVGRLANNESIIFNIAGATGTGKTTVARMSSSMWGNPNVIKGSWNNTQVGVERLLGATRNSLTYLDESGIAMEDGKKGLHLLGKTVYWIANNSGKGRGSKMGGMQKTEVWSQVVLSTAEVRLTSLPNFAGKGTQTRIIDIVEPPFMTNDEETRAMIDEVEAVISKNYGHLGMMMVKDLSALTEVEVEEKYRSVSAEVEKKLIAVGLERNLIGRLAKNWAVAFMGLEYLVKAFDLDAERAKKSLMEAMLASAGLLKGDSLRLAIFRAIQSWIIGNLITVEDEHHELKSCFDQKGIAADISADRSEVRIVPKALIQILQDLGFQVSDDKNFKELMKTDGVAANQSVRIKGQTVRGYAISMANLTNAVNKIEDEEDEETLD